MDDKQLLCYIIEEYLDGNSVDYIEENQEDIIDYIYMLGNMVDINTICMVNLFNRYIGRFRRCKICHHIYISTKKNRLLCSDKCREISNGIQQQRYQSKITKKDEQDDVFAIARAGLDQQGYDSKYLLKLREEMQGNGQTDLL